MPRTALVTSLATLVLAIAAGGCSDGSDEVRATDPASATPTPVELATLDGRTFVAADAADLEADVALADGSRITLGFAGEELAAYAGCNRLGGTVAIESGRLEVGELRSTNMACADEVMSQESWLAGFLDSSPEVTLTGDDELVLVSGEEMLRLTAE